MVANHPSGFFDLAAAPRQPLAATTLPTSPRKTRVGVFRHRSSGQTSSRGRCRSMFTPGLRGCGYKTVSGRHEWPNRDPIQERGGLNLYAYVGNNPINFLDPNGLVGWGVVGSASFGAGIGVGPTLGASAGAGVFIGPNSNGTPASFGGYVSYVPTPQGPNPFAIGLGAGAGGGFFLTDVNNANDLEKTCKTLFINIGFGLDLGISSVGEMAFTFLKSPLVPAAV